MAIKETDGERKREFLFENMSRQTSIINLSHPKPTTATERNEVLKFMSGENKTYYQKDVSKQHLN